MMGFTGIQWGGNMHKKCIGLRKNLPEDHAVPTSNSGSVGFRFPRETQQRLQQNTHRTYAGNIVQKKDVAIKHRDTSKNE
jgi:hypothetical protein